MQVYSIKVDTGDTVPRPLLTNPGPGGPVSLSAWKNYLAVGSSVAQLLDLNNPERIRQLNKV